MFFLTLPIIWSYSFFFIFFYIIFLTSFILYLIPIILENNKYIFKKIYFNIINSFNFIPFLYTPFLIFYYILHIWLSPSISLWFGHLILSTFQLKINYIILVTIITVMIIFSTIFYFNSKGVYDYLITIFQFFIWICLLFLANTIFSTIFLIEVLSTLLFLLLITSVFSSTFYYRNIDFSFGHIFQQILPYIFIQSILFFFWVSLISSLNLFLFLLIIYSNLLTLDFFLIEYLFYYYTNISSFKEIFTLGLSWFILLFCFFLKCGITPFFIWKPSFFKGLPLYTIFFYICFFYFFLFLFIIYFITTYFILIFYYYSIIIILFILSGIFILLSIICESYYFKIFMAISSILNSLLVFLTLIIPHNINLNFWI